MDKYDLLHWKRLIITFNQNMYEYNNLETRIKNIRKNIQPEDFELQFELEYKLIDVEQTCLELEDLLYDFMMYPHTQ